MSPTWIRHGVSAGRLPGKARPVAAIGRQALAISCLANTWAKLAGADGGAEGIQGVAQPGGRRPGDVALRPVLVVGLVELLGVLARRAEQQLLEVAEQVLPGLLGHLAVGDRGLQVADERGSRSGGRRQGAGVPGGHGWFPRLVAVRARWRRVARTRRLVRRGGDGRVRGWGGGGR